jgi:[ribosomal protein S5]-alanine N-acetyltransferase
MILRPLFTSRLILRPLVEADIYCIYEACSNPQMTAYTIFETHANRDVSANFVRHYAMPNYAQGVPEPYGITLTTAPDVVIGCVGGRWTETRCNCSVEVGYWIAEPYWNQGIATEALAAMLPFIREVLAPVRIQAHTMAPNVASARVLEKAGFTFEGTLRKAVHRRGQYWDIHMYSIVES